MCFLGWCKPSDLTWQQTLTVILNFWLFLAANTDSNSHLLTLPGSKHWQRFSPSDSTWQQTLTAILNFWIYLAANTFYDRQRNQHLNELWWSLYLITVLCERYWMSAMLEQLVYLVTIGLWSGNISIIFRNLHHSFSATKFWFSFIAFSQNIVLLSALRLTDGCMWGHRWNWTGFSCILNSDI
jgi:hypothetical protein